MNGMTVWQRIEGGLIFVIGVWVYRELGGHFGWWAPALFFVPDLSLAAYAFGPRVGAFCYNLVHIYAFGLILLMLGSLGGQGWLIELGALWFAQSGFDRMLGYGLKSSEGFSQTHLGRIGGRG